MALYKVSPYPCSTPFAARVAYTVDTEIQSSDDDEDGVDLLPRVNHSN